eukprot:TRINITY_DN26950_c0_g1_i1.p1 TRINITY_DN26950_c0_g1~~TRINITY_DN26950_c0_g1_i1.p1  ORF type:complete len:158 (+),score=27.41 TRINITY_DN26950_c0_g1_i1:98-571(+)
MYGAPSARPGLLRSCSLPKDLGPYGYVGFEESSKIPTWRAEASSSPTAYNSKKLPWPLQTIDAGKQPDPFLGRVKWHEKKAPGNATTLKKVLHEVRSCNALDYTDNPRVFRESRNAIMQQRPQGSPMSHSMRTWRESVVLASVNGGRMRAQATRALM